MEGKVEGEKRVVEKKGRGVSGGTGGIGWCRGGP